MKAQPLCHSAMAASFGFLWQADRCTAQADRQNPPLSIGCLTKQTSYDSCFEGEVGDNWQVSQEPVAETPIRHFRGWATSTKYHPHPTIPSTKTLSRNSRPLRFLLSEHSGILLWPLATNIWKHPWPLQVTQASSPCKHIFQNVVFQDEIFVLL